MKIFRFDHEVSIPVREAGSRFKVGPLIGPGSNVQIQVLHLAPGGQISEEVTDQCRLLAIMAGSGWVGGSGWIGGSGGRAGKSGSSAESKLRRKDLAAGYGALWDPGESHQAGSVDGLTAILIEGEFEMLAASVTRDIVVTEYSPDWPRWFDLICSYVWPSIEDVALRIDHVGSTSVPGLAATPIIDMDIVVTSDETVASVIERLPIIGYQWRGDLGVAGRQAFHAPAGVDLPEHHLYLVVENNKAHLDHWLLRDLLRADHEARARYEALKRKNVEVAGDDIDIYAAAKAKFVAGLLTRARIEQGLPLETYWQPESPTAT